MQLPAYKETIPAPEYARWKLLYYHYRNHKKNFINYKGEKTM